LRWRWISSIRSAKNYFILRGLILECSIVGVLSIMAYDYRCSICNHHWCNNGHRKSCSVSRPNLRRMCRSIRITHGCRQFPNVSSIAILLIVIRLIDDLILQPLCFGKSLDMHPVAVVLVIDHWSSIDGNFGYGNIYSIATILRVSAIETYWGLKHYTITA